MIYKWEDFKLEINESNSWKLFQFDFTGMSNTTETISTVAGKCPFGARAKQRPKRVVGMSGGGRPYIQMLRNHPMKIL